MVPAAEACLLGIRIIEGLKSKIIQYRRKSSLDYFLPWSFRYTHSRKMQTLPSGTLVDVGFVHPTAKRCHMSYLGPGWQGAWACGSKVPKKQLPTGGNSWSA